ncbi:hypothetical protein ACIQVK_44650 [Streptomyces sp. NPDC090493]
MTKLLLLTAVGLVGVALLHPAQSTRVRPPMARLQEEENRLFVELCRRAS